MSRPSDVAILRTVRAAGFASEAHLVSMCGEGSAERCKRLKADGMLGWGPTLGYWITAKGEGVATGHFATTVLMTRARS